ncbi:MAG TPA: hypothetical protein VKR06_12950 [Ktedonosporobacter sp.]|nr:hypothetical protein [Ktedonosporobacter sp.]
MKIAILERDPLLSDLLKRALELAGYTVVTSATLAHFFALQACDLPCSERVDLLILESDQNVLQEIASVLSSSPDLPVILLSSDSLPVCAATEGMLGVWVLQKPCKVCVLMRAIETGYRYGKQGSIADTICHLDP